MDNYRHAPVLAVLLAMLGLIAAPAQAADRPPQSLAATAGEVAGRSLNAAQLTAIRGIGRYVLAAKKSGSEDGADAAQLARLRASLDQLIAADHDLGNRAPITVQGQEASEQRKAREKVVSLRESARTDARVLASQLRQQGELKIAHVRSQPEQGSHSAGLPISEQRARLFERWAQKLDGALAEGNEGRIGQLRELREQLRTTQSSVNEAPLAHGTPTLQAMPAGFVPPKNDGSVKE
jgi:hypothetical protein